MPQLFQVLGLDFLLGNDEMWPLLLGLSGVAALLQFFLLLLCPESPRYLYIKLGKVEEAKKSKKNILGLSRVVFLLYIVLNTEGKAWLRIQCDCGCSISCSELLRYKLALDQKLLRRLHGTKKHC